MEVTVTQAKEQITSIASKVYTDYLEGSYTNFKNKYDEVKDKAKETFTKENAEKIPNQYKEWGEKTYEFVASKISSSGEPGKQGDENKLITRNNLETINYYLFQYSTIASEVLKQALSIPTDTLTNVAKNQSGKSTAGLISAQKINEMVKSQETKKMLGSLVMLYPNFKTYIEQIKGEQVHDAIKIIFSPEDNRMEEVLKTLAANMMSLSSKSTSDVASADEFVKQLLLGADSESKIKTGASNAKDLLDKQDVSNLLKEIEGVGESLEQLKDVLKTISQSDAGTPPSPQG